MPRTSADNVTYRAAMGHFPVSGYVIGTGAAINIDCGFEPMFVLLLNTEGLCLGAYIKNMDAASMFKIVDSGSGTTDISFVTSDGITIRSAGTIGGTGMGFTIGADTDVNVSGEDIYFFAM